MKPRYSPAYPLRALTFAMACAAMSAPLSAQADQASNTANPVGAETQEDEGLFGSNEPQQYLPAEMTVDEIVQFFNEFSKTPDIEQALAPIVAQMMTPGEAIADWNAGGIDIVAEVAKQPGGLGSVVFKEVSDNDLSFVDPTGRVEVDFTGFTTYGLRPRTGAPYLRRTITGFAPGIWIDIALAGSKKGNAQCFSGFEGVSVHSSREHTEWSEDELLSLATGYSLALRLASQEVCSVYSQNDKGEYTAKSFLPDGKPLDVMNEEPTARVMMPVEQIPEYLKKSPPPLMTAAEAAEEAAAEAELEASQ